LVSCDQGAAVGAFFQARVDEREDRSKRGHRRAEDDGAGRSRGERRFLRTDRRLGEGAADGDRRTRRESRLFGVSLQVAKGDRPPGCGAQALDGRLMQPVPLKEERGRQKCGDKSGRDALQPGHHRRPVANGHDRPRQGRSYRRSAAHPAARAALGFPQAFDFGRCVSFGIILNLRVTRRRPTWYARADDVKDRPKASSGR
jgi:hypothetical protein